MDNTFTREQLAQIDLIENAAYEAIAKVLGYDPEWNMYFIGNVADSICDAVVEMTDKTEMEVYPYTDSE